MTTTTLIHLSDLHLHRNHCDDPGCRRPECLSPGYAAVAERLAAALEAAGVRSPAAVLVTGDLFDSSDTGVEDAAAMLRALVERVRSAVACGGPPAPFVVLPGNHDRRRMGVVGRNDSGLFDALAADPPDGVQVLGTDRQFFAQRLELEDVPAVVIAYDSTFLPDGLVGAGGTIRSVDVLQLASGIADSDADLPVLILMHHHVVPTPVTDTGPIAAEGKPWWARAILRLAPRLFPYGNCEEPWMTAFGAGTALSTLHALGRAVLVLHGHKHYPTARVLAGTIEGDGDVLLVSAGSAGLAEPWMRAEPIAEESAPVHDREALPPSSSAADVHAGRATQGDPRLWPSFNLVHLSPDRLEIETVAFSLSPDPKPILRRPLLSATKGGQRWIVTPVPAPGITEVMLHRSQATYRLLQSAEEEYDLECERVLEFADGHVKPVTEKVEGLAGGMLELGSSPGRRLPAWLVLPEGTTRYVIRRAASQTLRRARAEPGYGPATAFEWVGLPNRYGAKEVVFHVEGLPDQGRDAFGSLTDLSSGREVPIRLERTKGRVSARVADCPARRLLRVYWPLRSGAKLARR